jgi:hypothetical protein
VLLVAEKRFKTTGNPTLDAILTKTSPNVLPPLRNKGFALDGAATSVDFCLITQPRLAENIRA